MSGPSAPQIGYATRRLRLGSASSVVPWMLIHDGIAGQPDRGADSSCGAIGAGASSATGR